ncbi:MAG: YIEGIA family protein [Syntrophomonadaceae bacterium]|nr:YIEGIA family protein [Syntrophomonadaceae bacterium]MDD3022702.1 YIEGIA family protein [Syntrophomonadaceae bacterium]
MEKYLIAVLAGIISGFADRWLMLRSDYRYYPTYPHAYFTHLALGFIAASLGAVAIPALAKPDYVAVTFLVLAAQQFRDIRNMERETLNNLEKTKLIPRGNDYIEGIARVFEARNYLVILTALINSGIVYYLGWQYVFISAPLCFMVSLKMMAGSHVGDIAQIETGKLFFDGSMLRVNDVVIMNVGLHADREKILEEGMGVIIKPIDDNARLTLDAPGQRMAIIHDAVSILGSKVDMSETQFAPLARKHIDKGYLAMFLLANEPDIDYLIEIIKRVPVLESTRGTSLNSFYGRKAAD